MLTTSKERCLRGALTLECRTEPVSLWKQGCTLSPGRESGGESATSSSELKFRMGRSTQDCAPVLPPHTTSRSYFLGCLTPWESSFSFGNQASAIPVTFLYSREPLLYRQFCCHSLRREYNMEVNVGEKDCYTFLTLLSPFSFLIKTTAL